MKICDAMKRASAVVTFLYTRHFPRLFSVGDHFGIHRDPSENWS
jgi:hypothetical protein